MSSLWFNVLVVVVLVLLGGFFVAAELAIVSLRESQVDRLEQEGGRRGKVLADLSRHPNRFLAACQVGVTLTGFISAAFGEAQIAPFVEPVLVEHGVNPAVANVVVLIVVTSLIAYFALVVGELVPKRIALQRGERIALVTARPLHAVATFLRPVIALLSISTDAVVRLLGMDPKAGRETISEEELISLVATHEDLSLEERSLISDVFAAGDRELREVMLPRTEVSFLEAAMTIADAVAVVAEQPHSRYPTIRDSSDDVVGFVHVRDLLSAGDRAKRVNTLVRPIGSFPGTNQVLVTLAEMRRNRQHLAIVQDEYGGTAGIVTLEDLVEELIGDVTDEFDVVRVHDSASGPGEIVMDGLVNLEDFEEVTGFALPEGPYETVAGFVVALLGRVPQLGDAVRADGHEFHVVELDGRRVSRVAVRSAVASDPTQ
jgi:putative hemolysin